MWVTPDRFNLTKYTDKYGRYELTIDRVHGKQGVDVMLSDGGQSNGMSLDEHDLRMLLIWYLNWPEASRREPPLGDKMVDAIELGWNAGTSGRTLSAAINDARQIFAPDTESSKAQAKK